MEPLRVKFARELADSACVVACRFPIEGCRAREEVGAGLDTVWLYDKRDLLTKSDLFVKTDLVTKSDAKLQSSSNSQADLPRT